MGKARRDMGYAARSICLPEPVGPRIFEFLEQQTDHLAFLVEACFRDPSLDERTPGLEAGRDQQYRDCQ